MTHTHTGELPYQFPQVGHYIIPYRYDTVTVIVKRHLCQRAYAIRRARHSAAVSSTLADTRDGLKVNALERNIGINLL